MSLAHERCRHGARRLDAEERSELLAQLPGWSLEGEELVRSFEFSEYGATLGFVNAVAWVARAEDHHPTLVVDYGRVTVRFTTHDAGGLTRNDLIAAAKVQALLPPA